MKVGDIDLSLHNYTLTGQERFGQFVSDCGGIYKASVKLDVPSFFVEQVLRNEPVPDHVLDRIEQKVGPIRLLDHTSGFSNVGSLRKLGDTLETETEPEITLKEFVRSCGGCLAASLKLGVSTSTIENILSGVPLSGPTIKKVLAALKAIDCSMASDRSNSPLSKLHSLFEMSGLPESPTHQRGVYPSTVLKLQEGLPISKATQRKLGISSEDGETVPTPDHARTNLASDLASKLREIVKSDVDMFDLASTWGVTETSLRKIYEGKPVTRALVRKVATALQGLDQRNLPTRPSAATERLRTIHELYNQLGTLEAVGRHVGLTRERVRQLLAKGKKIGLFEYNPHEYPYVSKEKLIEDYLQSSNLGHVAKVNQIPPSYLRKLLTAYSITEQQLATHRKEAKRSKCVEQYGQLVAKAGHHLTTTELQSTREGHALNSRVIRFWGSIDTFRQELNIPAPTRIRPHWLDPWLQIALVKRMQHLDTIRDCMSTSSPVGVLELSQKSTFGANRVRRLLALLLASREVKRIGQLANTKYLLASN